MTEKTSFITIIGRPNVGKSSLLNKILGQKIAIVSDKPQTTRTRIMGVLTEEENQFVFIDTPGFHKPKNILGDNMMKIVNNSLSDVDLAVFVVDAAPNFKFDENDLPKAEIALLQNLKSKNIPAILVVNKIDVLKDKEELFPILSAYNKAFDFDSCIPLSAKTGDGVKILKDELNKYLKESPHFFQNDEYTDQPDRTMVAEIIREKLLRILQKEVPHGIAVDIERFFERDLPDGSPILEVEAVIYTEKATHKGIIIGKGGAMLKKIGTVSRIDIEKFFGIKANLKLWVKVKEDWRNRENVIHTFGLDFQND